MHLQQLKTIVSTLFHLLNNSIRPLLSFGEQNEMLKPFCSCIICRFIVNKILFTPSYKKTIMDTCITIWEMNLEPDSISITREEVATGPSEPYTLDWDSINWN